MPGRGGSGHARSHSSVDHGLRISHSGMWVGRDAGPDDSTQMHLIDFPYEQVPRIRTTEVREHGQFVTVVEVEKDDADKSGSTRHASRAATQPVPRPRGFVTVVAVGNNADTSLHLNTGNVAVDANLKHRTEHRADVEADYVNQEMIDRERKTAEEWQTETVPDQVVVYRLPGERLGLGLKFDGGMGARERVRRLFIQSVAPDSPAARAAVPWGELQPGDQILNIEGWAVSSMTRVQCVSFLKDAAMKITIGVHKGNGQLPDFDMCTSEAPEYVKEEGQEEAEAEDDNEDSSRPPPLIVGEMRKRLPPPPLPPRARPRKSPARPPKDPTPVPPPPSAFQDLYDESGEKMARGMYPTSGNSEDVEHSMHGWREYVLSRRTRPSDLEELLEDLEFHLPRTWTTRRVDESMDGGLPPRPTFYVDLVGEEDAMGPCGSESDETSSSVSTVIDRLSLCSSTNVSRNSSFNASADASRFDLARALSPFEQLEKELETDTQQQQQTPATAPRDEVMPAPPIDRSTKPTTAESSIPEVEQHAAVSRKTSSSKIKMRPSIKSFSFSLKGRPFSWQQGKSASDRGVSRSDTFLSIKKPGKRPAPPPPPRSIDSGTRQSESPPTVTSSMGVETGMGIRERISHPDNDTIHDDSDNYIDLIAEAANQNLHYETTAVTSNVSEREVTTKVAKEELTLPFLAQVKQPKHSPEYLLILDSPPGPDVLDKFPDKSFYTGVAGDVNSELPDTVQEEYRSLGAGERVVIQAETSPRSVTTPPEVIELCTSDHNSESLQQESSLSEATASSAGGGSPCLSDDYIFSTSQNCIETRAQVHHALDDTVDTETIAICQSLENEDLETGSVRELSNKGEMDNGIDVEVSELDGSKSPDDSGEVDVSTDIDASVDDEFDERTVESTKLTYNSGLISVTGRDNGTNINGTPLVDNIMEADSSERTDGYSEMVGDVSEKVDDDVSEKADDVNEKVDDIAEKVDDVSEMVDDIAEKVDDVSEMVDDVSEKVDISEKVDDVSEMVDDVSEKVDDVSEKVDDVSEMVDDVSEKVDDVSEIVDDVSEKVDDVSEMVDISEKADDVSEKVDISEKVDDVSEKVDISEKADDVSEKVDDISEKVDVSEKVDDDVSEKVDDDVSEKADVSEKVDISEKADVSEKVDISEKSDDISEKSDDISEKADDASEMVDDISEKTDDSMKGDYSTEGEVSTDYDDSEMLISESLDDSCERNDNQQTAVSNAKAEETYVQDNIAGIPEEEEEEEGFLSCSSPKTSPTEPLLPGRAPKLPGVAEEEGLYEDLYDECYPLDTPADPRSRGSRDFNVARSLRREVSRALPIVPEEDSGDLDTTEGDLTALYDDIADESGEGTSAEAMSLDVSDEVDVEGLAVPSVQLETGGSKASLTIGQCSRQRRLRPDLGDLIRREMNLSDDVTVEVEEEEEVENLVECENEKELLLVMRALRQEHSSDHLRWLQDDSEGDDDDAGGGGGGGGAGGGTSEGSDGATEGDDHHRESDEGEDEHEDEPAAEDVCKDDPAGGGQGAAARALSDPQVGGGEGGKKEEEVVGGEKQLPPSFSPPQVAAAHSPATSLHHHSLAQGTTRHPRHATLPLTRALPSHAGGRPHAHATHHAQDTASEIGLASGGEPRVTQTVRQADHSPNWSLVSSEGAFECAAREESSQSATCGVRSVVARTLESATSSGTAMVARTDTNQAGKVTNCLDNVESLALLARGGEQNKGEAGDGAAPVAPDAEGAISLGGTSDASSSDGEEPQVAETSRSSEDTPEPPDFSTHPMCTEEEVDEEDYSQRRLADPPTDGSVRAEPIIAVPQHHPGQSAFEVDAPLHHTDQHSDTGGGSSVSVSACEHRYAATSGAPPPYSRLPPDGHEFPSSYAEGLPDKLSRFARYSRLAMDLDSPPTPAAPTPRTRSAPGTPLGPPPPIPRTSQQNSKSYTSERTLEVGGNKWAGEERRSREPTPTRGRWRRQDERSEKSVRDKIAMFSTDGPDQPHPKTRKLDKVEGDETTMKRAFTEDDVRLEHSSSSSSANCGREVHNGSRSLSKTSAFSSMINVSTAETKDSIKPMSTASSEVDIRQDIPPAPRRHELREEKRAEDDTATTGLHGRSQSLIDIGRSTLTKRHSVGAYDRPSVYQYGIEKPEERERRTSLTNLIEQRRKSFGCKLRGLVIPESRSSDGGDKTAIDLPRIASVPPSTAAKTMSLPREGQRSPRLYKADSISSIDSCESNTSRHSSLNAPPWKNHNTSTLPKYSPAFKRKNMSVFNKCDNLPPPSGRTHGTRSASPTSDSSHASPIPPAHSPTKSMECFTTQGSEHSFEFSDSRYSNDRHSYSKLPLSQKSSLDSRLSRAEDSDNDSAVSSTQSSFSQGMSPPSSPMPEQDDHDDCRSRTYRSQSSIDEQEAARRVLKRGSIEAENRRNVLNSARVSSGRSSDEQQTPEIIRKYSTSERSEESDRFPNRLDTELRDGPKVTGLRRQPSTSSTSSSESSRRSSHDSSRRNSRDSVIHVAKYDEAKVSAEPVYFDQEGEMYKEAQLKVAYLNEIVDDFEQLNEPANEEVIAEVPMSPSRRVVENSDSTETITSATSSFPTRRSERWAALEMKYGSSNPGGDTETKLQRLRRASDSTSPDRTKKKSGGFRALAEKWQQRAEEDTSALSQPQLTRKESTTRLDAPTRHYDERSSGASTLERPTRPSRLYDDPTEIDGNRPTRPTCLYSESAQSPMNSRCEGRAEILDIPRAEVPDRKLSMPEYGSGGIKMRDRRDGSVGGAPSRPTSLIEGGDAGVMDSHYLSAGASLSPAASTDSRDDLCSTPEASLSRTASKEVLDAFSRPRASIGASLPRMGASNTPKMADIMRAFERHDLNKRGTQGYGSSHPRMSSIDSTASDDGCMGAHYGSVTSLASGQRDQYGSITSLASSTSLISPQELAQLIEEANQSLEESGTPSHEILVVVLHREIVGHGSIGITLAGGADYEAKEITVHKVIPGSLADRDGRIQRGDRVLSINGKNLRGVTHREALTILKSPRPEVVLVLSRSRSVTPQESSGAESEGSFVHRPALINHITSPRPPKILESPMDSKSLISDAAAMSVPRGPPLTITLMKDGAGLGFSLEGGKDSPLGDRPLTVKKIFSGGAADKGGILKVGDELVSVNTVDVTGMARIEAWNFLKKLPDGTVSLVLRQKLEDPSAKSEE